MEYKKQVLLSMQKELEKLSKRKALIINESFDIDLNVLGILISHIDSLKNRGLFSDSVQAKIRKIFMSKTGAQERKAYDYIFIGANIDRFLFKMWTDGIDSLCYTKCVEISKFNDQESQIKLFSLINKHKLTVREVKCLVQRIKRNKDKEMSLVANQFLRNPHFFCSLYNLKNSIESVKEKTSKFYRLGPVYLDNEEFTDIDREIIKTTDFFELHREDL